MNDALDVTPQMALNYANNLCNRQQPDKALVILLYQNESPATYQPVIINSGLTGSEMIGLLARSQHMINTSLDNTPPPPPDEEENEYAVV